MRLVPPRPRPFREDQRKLEAVGFTEIGQRGSHVKFAARDTGNCVIAINLASRNRQVVVRARNSRTSGKTRSLLKNVWT